MNTREQAALRAVGWIVLVLTLLGCSTFGAKDSVDRPDVKVTATTLRADLEASGAWCWTGGSDRDPNLVIVTDLSTGETKVSDKQRVIDWAIEQAVFDIDHGMTVHAFCE